MDPSQASINAIQPEQTETIICMDLKYYNAAAEGNIEVFKDVTDPQSLHLLRTPIKNTILHIYITTLNSESKSTTTLDAGSESTTTPNAGSKSTTNFVKKILKMCPLLLWKTNAGLESTTTLKARLESTTTLSVGSESTTNFVEEILKMCPDLLQQTNAKDETLLHIAARYGHDDIVKFLLDYCSKTLPQDLEDGIKPVEKMVRMTNKKRDTALHEAIRYNHPIVVELLIEKDSNFSYPANDADETPLYIAAERGFKSLVFKILAECKSPMHGGPLGRTALHAAIIANNGGMTQTILDKIEGISRKVDNNSWTPLHLAAYFDHSNLAELLLNKDREVAYMKDTKGMTALHIAAQRCSTDAMERIVLMCPDCCELVDNKGWNVLHFVMKSDKWPWHQQQAINIIIENPSLRNLLNEKNANGDTPLHIYSSTLESVKNFINHRQVDKMAFNEQNLSAYDIASTNTKLPAEKKLEIMNAIHPPPRRVITYDDEDEKNKDEDKKNKDGDKKEEDERSSLQKAAETHLVVAALITTVTFAACITMPGGFAGGGEGSHPGSTLLRRNAAFKAFVITDTISMVFSSSAVFIHLLIPFLEGNDANDKEHRDNILDLAFRFILWAMVAMVLAFVTGTYAVLLPSLDLAIANCIIGLTFFATLLFGFPNFVKISFSEGLRFFLFLD